MKYILILFFPIMLFSQSIAKVNYSVFPTNGSFERSEDVAKSTVSSSFVGVDDALKKMDYELLVNETKSYFHLIPGLDLNNKISRVSKAVAGPGEYHKDNKKRMVIKVIYFSGETFNVLLRVNHNWKLINETKVINGFICYKALTEKKLKTDRLINVIAWYCPSIPIANGPKEYGDLPGLIMELQDNVITYLVSKIQIDKNLNIKIKDIKGDIISEDEYKVIVDKTLQNTINSFRKE